MAEDTVKRITQLKRTRASMKARLTQFQIYLNTAQSYETLSALHNTELECRLAVIEKLHNDFDALQTELEMLSEPPDEQYAERALFENQYFSLLAGARQQLLVIADKDGQSGSITGSVGETCKHIKNTRIALPKIQISTFDGSYQNWLEFRDTFRSLIHLNSDLDNVSKFHYLRSALVGSAAVVVANIDFTADNYLTAFNSLMDRYDNPRLLVNNHVQTLFNVEPILKESSKAIRTLIDTTNKNIRALTALKQPTQYWDMLIIHMMASKLDSVTFRHWEEERNKLAEAPTLLQFCSFLQNRADLLETLEEAKNKIIPEVKPTSTKTYLTVTNQDKQQCPMCKGAHALYNCEKFRNLTIENRIAKVKNIKVCQNCLKPGHTYNKCKLSHCRYCKFRHNSLIHLEKQEVKVPTSSLVENVALPTNSTQPIVNQVALSSDTNQHTTSSNLFLSTALVKVYDNKGNTHTARILLDNGSTANFVTQYLCDQLGLMTRSTHSTVTGICNQASISSQSCNLTIQSRYNDFKVDLQCLTLPQITKALPSRYIDVDHIKIPTGLELADPSYNVPSAIQILVGAETFWSVIGTNSIDLGKNQPKLYETKLGWLVSGHVSVPSHNRETSHYCHFLDQEENLTRFWELDTISAEHSLTHEERACEEHFDTTTYQESDGRFVVTMPLKRDPHELGDSYNMAKCRFLSLERRFQREPTFKQMYVDFMKEYEHLGHMSENTVSKNHSAQLNGATVKYYIPHHGVIRKLNNTVSLRTVFDASAPTSTKVSLNNLQMVGPNVQDDLLSILLRFRQHKIVVSADIEKMYRAINLNPLQRPLQQIIFRYDKSEPLKTYTLNTITYGMTSAAYLATKCLSSLADKTTDGSVKFAISRDFYVDDYLSGGSSKEEVIDTCKGVISVLSSAQFNLRKYQSNCPEVLSAIFETKTNNLKDLSSSDSKTLGLHWLCDADTLSFSINIDSHEKTTKRRILSAMNQIFDPLGLVGPSIIEAKVIMQDLWLQRVSWDDEVPEHIKKQWTSFASKLIQLNNVKVPRWVLHDNYKVVELHTFTDAAERLYSSCIYVRSIGSDGSIHTQLLVSKNRVCPTKPNLTIPKKELLGALLGSRLCAKVLKSITLPVSCRYWSDSMIVLGWLATQTPSLRQFVRNRVNEIKELTAGSQWSYVPGNVNPADLLTRPGKADLVSDCLWWHGPQFLHLDQTSWPNMPNTSETKNLPEVLCHTTQNNILTTHPISILIHKQSNYTRLLHTAAYVQRFIFNCRHKNSKIVGNLTYDELQRSHNLILEQAQSEMFPKEHSLLKSGKSLSPKNQLISWSPFLDPKDKLIRAGGRLDNSPYTYDEKHPILLCSKHHLTKLIFRNEHSKLFHAGPLLLLSNIRQRYWPLGGRNLAKHVVHNCHRCVRYRAKTVQPIMGQLPESRTQLEFPFLHTFVDYAGPVLIASRKGRGAKLIKCFLTIFVCSATKAVSLDLAESQSAHSYLLALHRFVARRGKPLTITSDNAGNFVGLRNQLNNHSSLEDIKFLFSPPYSPHMNGLAEAAVRSTKHHLRRVLSLTHLTFEEMSTCLAQIESILNSRPLTPLSSMPSEYSALTPAHFLIGRSLTAVCHPQVQPDANINFIERYKRVALIKDHFWRRFSNEYICTLQQKSKWSTESSNQLLIGSLVVVKDKTLPPPLWLLGRVAKVHVGADGGARVVDIRTAKGTIRRGWNNICPLPMDEPSRGSMSATTCATTTPMTPATRPNPAGTI